MAQPRAYSPLEGYVLKQTDLSVIFDDAFGKVKVIVNVCWKNPYGCCLLWMVTGHCILS